MAVFKSNIDWDNYDPAEGCNPSGTDEIDPEIAGLITLMNQTGWIRTCFSCQGGHGDNTEPYVAFSCLLEKVSTLQDIFDNAHAMTVEEPNVVAVEIPTGSTYFIIRLSETDPEAISSLEAAFREYLDNID